jgi:hypothetical protein
MTWEDILKISTEDAIADARRYAPEEMDNARRAAMDADMKAILPRMQDLVERVENTTDGLIRRNAMQTLKLLGGKLGMRRSPHREPLAFINHVKSFIKANRRYLE